MSAQFEDAGSECVRLAAECSYESDIEGGRLNPIAGERSMPKAPEQSQKLEREHQPSRIVQVGNRMRAGNDPRIAWVRAYHESRTLPNLLRLLDVAGDVEGLRPIRSRLEACVRTAGGHQRVRCGLYGCPSCGSKLAKKESLDALKMIVAKHGGVPDPKHVSFVTIRGAQTELKPGPVVALMKSLGTRIRKTQKHMSLRQSSWIGWMDVSLKGVVHWHGLVLHVGTSKRAFGERLKSQFRAPRAVKVKAWSGDKSNLENIFAVLRYSLPAARHSKIKRGKPAYGVDAPRLIAERLVCLNAMARTGVRGIRLKLNIESPRYWKAGVLFDPIQGETIVVPELEDQILRRRRRAKRGRSAWFTVRVQREGRKTRISN